MTARNRSQWLHIAAALDADPMRDLAAHARAIGRAAAEPALPSLLVNTGTRRRATSPAREAGAVGRGDGAAGPMPTVVRLVPSSLLAVLRATAQGIVTRMGQDPLAGLGGEAIEPGPAGMRPASAASPIAADLGAERQAAALGREQRSAATGAAAIDTPPSNTGVNKVSEKWA